MKKPVGLLVVFILMACVSVFASESHKAYQGSGEVLSVEPLYSRITIRHGKIKGLSGGPESDFLSVSALLLKDVEKRDLVEFTLEEDRGDLRLVKITKIGQAQPKEESSEVDDALHGVLDATNRVAQGVTAPLPPAQRLVKGTLGAASDTTEGAVDVSEGNPQVKRKF